jgi:hypothetical protein
MKASWRSVPAIGFAILVIAIDFAVIRAAFLSRGSKGWGDLPEMRHCRLMPWNGLTRSSSRCSSRSRSSASRLCWSLS